MLLDILGRQAREASASLAKASTSQKNEALLLIAEALKSKSADILDANLRDINHGAQIGLAKNLIDRLTLDRKRIEGMAEGVRQIASLPDPVYSIEKGFVRPNGLKIDVMRVPLGVIGVIYEARPNVTVDAAALCLKTGNAVILRGGSDASASSICLTEIMREALTKAGIDKNAIQYVEDPSRETAEKLMKLKPNPLTDATTLLILSDTKTTGQKRAMHSLEEAKRLAGKVIILNPIPEGKWKFLRSAQEFSTAVTMISCSTLRDLAAACRKLTT